MVKENAVAGTKSLKQRARTKSQRPITWDATERAPRKRWWWWAAMAFLTYFFAFWAFSYGNWTFALLIVVMGIALGYTYGSKTLRHLHYSLEGNMINASRFKPKSGGTERAEWGHQTLDLEKFECCYVDDVWQSGQSLSSTVQLTLIPVKARRFSWTGNLFLPEDDAAREKVLSRITQHVPLVSAENTRALSYRRGQRWLAWIALKIGL